MDTELERLTVRLMGDSSSYTAMMQQVQATTSTTVSQVQRSAGGIQSLAGNMEVWGQSALGILGQLGIAVGGLALAQQAVAMAASAEDMTVTFGVMLNSAAQGAAMIGDLQKLAAETPYELPSLLNATKMMLQYGVAADEVLPILKDLGDVTGGDAVKLQQLTYAFSQASALGRLTGGDLRQMVNAGFNPLKEIARTTGKSLSYMQEEMRKGRVSAEMMTGAFRSASGPGGQFFQHMAKRSQTLTGLFSTMKDDIGAVLRGLGKEVTGALDLKDVVRGVSAFAKGTTEFFQGLRPEVQQVASALMTVTGILGGLSLGWVILAPAVIGTWTTMTTVFWGSIAAVKGVAASFAALHVALTTAGTAATTTPLLGALATAGPYLAVAAAIAAIGYGVYRAAGGAEVVAALNDQLSRSAELSRRAGAQMEYETQAMINRFDSMTEAQRRQELEKALEQANAEIDGTSRNLESMNRQLKEQAGFWSAMSWAATGFQASSLAPIEESISGQAELLKKARERAEQFREELKKMGKESADEALTGALNKRTAAMEKEARALGLVGIEAEIVKNGWDKLPPAALANVRALAAFVEEGRELVKQKEDLQRETKNLTESLREELATFGMSAERAKLYKLEVKGLSEVSKVQLDIMGRFQEAVQEREKLTEKGKSLAESVRTPLEEYRDRIKELRQMFAAGAIDQKVFGRAVDEAKESLRGAREEAQRLDVVLAGGAEAKARIVEYQNRVFGPGASTKPRDSAADVARALAEPIVPGAGPVVSLTKEGLKEQQEATRLLGLAVGHLADLAAKGAVTIGVANLKK